MNSQEFKDARQSLGLSVSEFGKIINTDSRTVRRWEAVGDGGRPPNPIACKVMGWLLLGFSPSNFE